MKSYLTMNDNTTENPSFSKVGLNVPENLEKDQFKNDEEEWLNSDLECDLEEGEIDFQNENELDEFDTLQDEILPTSQPGHNTVNIKHNIAVSKRRNGYKLYTSSMAFKKHKRKIDKNIPGDHQQQKYRHRECSETENTLYRCGIDNYSRSVVYEIIFDQVVRKVDRNLTGRSYPRAFDEVQILHGDYIAKKAKVPQECIVKLYRYDKSGWMYWRNHDMLEAAKMCNRYCQRDSIMKREISSLKKLQRIPDVHCPRIFARKYNVVVMSFIGTCGKSARKLKDLHCAVREYTEMYKEIIEAMRSMFQKASIVHADLRPDNILWHEEHCYFINFYFSLNASHESALDYLYRDCNDVINFFKERKVPNMITTDDLFQSITGLKYTKTLLPRKPTFTWKCS